MLNFTGSPKLTTVLLSCLLAIGLAACGDEAQFPEEAGVGKDPKLPEPKSSVIPTVNIAPAIGWPQDAKPKAAEGFAVNAMARDLDHPRWMYVLPNGDILVAETSNPAGSGGRKGIEGWVMKQVMQRAGSAKPSANRITLLRDADGDGNPELRTVFLENLNSPFGMALVGSDLYVANADALMRFPYQEGQTKIDQPGVKIADLPAGMNHHWTKSLLASQDGSRLYVGVGSNSNAAENGMDVEVNRAAILEVDPATGVIEVFASGLRNPIGLDWNPETGQLWAVVNERDEIGSDLVPDYMTSVKKGGFYGWPYSYFGQHVDERVQPQRPELVKQAIVPDYALGAHTASMGLTFYRGDLFPPEFKNGAFVGQHGSWNRQPRSGYKVIFVPFKDGQPTGQPKEVLTGFLSPEGEAWGRPVGVTEDKKGAILVADDVGNVVWRVTPGPAPGPGEKQATAPPAGQ